MKHKSTVKQNGGGRIQMAEEHTIVSAAKGNRLQLIPLIAVLAGLGILVYRFWLNTSALYAPFYALMALRGCWCVDSVIGCNNNYLFVPQKSYSYRGCDIDYNYIVDYSPWRVYSMQCAEIVCY